jgi:hypothetical protein
MLSIPKALEEKKKYSAARVISDVVMSRGNRRFLLTNLQAQIWGVTANFSILFHFLLKQKMLVLLVTLC